MDDGAAKPHTTLERVVGRGPELAAALRFLDHPDPPALLITGPAGIGKTTLWEATLDAARERGYTALVSRPSEAENELSFAGLADLLEGALEPLIESLPAPQRRALNVAVARIEAVGAPPEPLAIAAGLLGIVRNDELGERVLIAVDDAQWLDQASAGALAFACRRALGERVRLLLAVRAGLESTLEREVPCSRLDLGALTVAQAGQLVFQELGLSVPRPLMTRLVDAAGGNPLAVLELGRLLLERGTLDLGAELPVPGLAGELFGARVRALPDAVGDALLIASLSGQMTRAELATAADPSAVAEASAYGVLALEGDRVRATHPLLAAAAREDADPERRRAAHLKLARALADPERAARHLALATASPDGERATVIADAAVAARRRGATRDAVDLAEHALRLTPEGDANEVERLLTFGEYLLSAGEIERRRSLFEAGIAELPAGPPRARAHMLLGEASNTAGQVNHLEQAIAEAEEHPDLRAAALAAKAMMFTVLLLAQIEAAERWAEEALELVLSAGGQGERRVLAALAWSRALRGRPLVDLQERFQLAHDARASLYEASVDRVIGVQHGFRGELAEAQAMFERLLEIADQRGEALSGEVMRLHLVETAVRRGDCRLIQQTLDEWEQWATLEDLAVSRVRTRALVGAMTGDGAEVRAAADALSEIREPPVWDQLEVARALGITALFERRPTDAAGHLGPVWEHTECEGVADPGAFPVAPDLVQALSELDRGEEAAQIAAMVRARAQAQDHPWATATAARCEAQLALAARWDEAAARALADAAAAYGALGLGFDQGRTLLALGGAQRRYRKWGRARDALRAAVEVFESLGCAGWAEQARSELERVGARRPAGDGELTSAEARVVALAAGGLSNKQIAAELVVTIHTVEVHLSRAYAKLGVRSRAQLAQALAALE